MKPTVINNNNNSKNNNCGSERQSEPQNQQQQSSNQQQQPYFNHPLRSHPIGMTDFGFGAGVSKKLLFILYKFTKFRSSINTKQCKSMKIYYHKIGDSIVIIRYVV